MSTKIRSVILGFIMLAAVTMSVLAISTVLSPVEAAELTAEQPSRYLLRLEGGEIIVYKDGETIKTGISISGLREQDRLLLENGIRAESYEDILKLIEDFNS